jgi:hypothetical protein
VIDLGNFVGPAVRLDGVDIPMMADRINVPEDRVRALDETESRGDGFDSKGRPKMLFEPHLFYRLLEGDARAKAVKAGLAYAKWKKDYPPDSFPRLLRAMEIDRDAALKSASWGRYQTLGSHHRVLGYRSPDAMIHAFMQDEDSHLEAFVSFIIVNRIDDDLREGRYDTFFAAYNGPAYRENGYPQAFARNLRKWEKIADSEIDHSDKMISDVTTVKTVQTKLHELGYHEVGIIDGQIGSRVRGAILAFRSDHDLPLVPIIDQELLAGLMQATARPVSEERATATATELKDKGSTTIAAADATKGAAVVVAGGSVASGLLDQLNALDGASTTAAGIIGRLQPYAETIQSVLPYLLGAVAVYIVYKQFAIVKTRVAAYRAGENVSEGTLGR